MKSPLSRTGTYVCICIKCEHTERFINLCRHKSVKLWDIEKKEEDIFAKIGIKEFYKLRPICRITGARVRITQRCGVPFLLFKYRKHYSFGIGVLVAVILIMVWSKFVWDITFVGNSKYTDGVLLEYLKSSGVYAGMPLASVDCAKLEADIRNQYNEITWVSAKISGTKLEISLKENDVMGVAGIEEGEDCDIVATESGVVESIITRKGTPLVKVGDTVEKGQILVSGVVKIIDDAGTHVANIYTESDADIMIKTTREYSDKLVMEYEEKIYTGRTKEKKILGITNTNCEMGIIFSEFEHADVVTNIRPMKINRSFALPVYYGTKKYYEYELQVKKYSEDGAKAELDKHFLQYLKDLSQKEVQIPQYNVKMFTEGDCFVMSGTIDIVAPLTEYKPVTDIEIIVNEENKEVQ